MLDYTKEQNLYALQLDMLDKLVHNIAFRINDFLLKIDLDEPIQN